MQTNIKANRKLLPGMFTGYVDKEYAKHRHSYGIRNRRTEKIFKSTTKKEDLREQEILLSLLCFAYSFKPIS